MKIKIKSLAILASFLCVPFCLFAAQSIWLSSPHPKFPTSALESGAEGSVTLHLTVDNEGKVKGATVAKSSGNSILDAAACTGVLKWKMNPALVKPEYLSKGYDQRIDFRQEAPVGIRYRDRRAYFSNFNATKIWTYAPFPEYPYHERLVRNEGIVFVRVQIGAEGRVSSATLAKSSGNSSLDNAAISAVKLWRAHKIYAGKQGVFPVRFQMSR